MKLLHTAILVRDYDEALRFYCDVLGWELLEDQSRPGDGKRWVRVGSRKPGSEFSVVLTRASTPDQLECVGKQLAGKVILYLAVDDLRLEVQRLADSGVTIAEAIREEPYGKVAVIADLYGNRIDLIQLPL